jgi:hypothetical protein
MPATPTSQGTEDFEMPAMEWFGPDENSIRHGLPT